MLWRRLARAVVHPMQAELTKQMMSFSSKSQGVRLSGLSIYHVECCNHVPHNPPSNVSQWWRALCKAAQEGAHSGAISMTLWCPLAGAGYLEYFPQLAGQTFADLAFWFDDAIVMGLVNRRTGICRITPDPTTMVGDGRPLAAWSCLLGPLTAPHTSCVQAAAGSLHTEQ